MQRRYVPVAVALSRQGLSGQVLVCVMSFILPPVAIPNMLFTCRWCRAEPMDILRFVDHLVTGRRCGEGVHLGRAAALAA